MSSLRWFAVFALLSLGCSADKSGSDPSIPLDGGAGDGFSFGDTLSQEEVGLFGDVAVPETPDMAPAAAVYAHSSNTLYKLDPDTKAVTVIGNFSGCGSVVDIALDAKSNIYASAGGIFLVDKNTAKCTSVGGGSFAGNSLSFVPAGTIDPAKEVLVTYSGGQYMRVDVDKGTTTNLGSLPFGYSSSGDIVSVKGGGTYVTVNGNGCGDCLLEVNPKTGAMIKNWGSLGTGGVYGIAYWAGSVYAFNDAGQIFEVTFSGDKVVTKEIPIPMRPSGLSFWGAGSTTAAPVVPVK
jgi:hypothetical protein